MTFEYPAVSARQVTKTFGDADSPVHALRSVDLNIVGGAVTAIMGPSGSGKTTLLQVLAGLDSPTSGQVLIGETDITQLGDGDLTQLRRTHMGFVFQSFNLLPSLSALENIRLPFLLAGRRIEPEVSAWITTVTDRLGLANRLDHRPHQLSGGQQQRVAIARALATRPHVIFADEPTGALDSASGAEVLALLRSACEEFEQTVVVITHDPQTASIADRVVHMLDGTIVDDWAGGNAEQIAARVMQRSAR
ncbi:peptide ABC transporter ATP-binding protein [Subtercola boreus]|uniref:Peptide ABC transporter ATP-binding protein n=1 Tax=Subtercola boreus TaxID=120213 RepID=A0A3E0VB99_9MICO|nr:ABC transporter ATP-binding protein [Subtercola boreus]RFA06630.1 peptide ABC transporter ATP-binding protein [Subtercola boreus]